MALFPNPPWRNFHYSGSLFFILGLAVIVGLFAVLQPRLGGEPVRLQIEVPDDIYVDEESDTIPINVSLRLINNTRQPVELQALNNCYVFRWLVVFGDETTVQSHTISQCGDEALTGTIEPRSSLVNQTTLYLDPGRVPPGHRYRLVVRYWGYESNTMLRIRETRD